MTEPLIKTINKAIENILDLSDLKHVLNALEWLSRSERFFIGGNKEDDERLLVNIPSKNHDDRNTTNLATIRYAATQNNHRYRLVHRIDITLNNQEPNKIQTSPSNIQ